MTPYDNLRLWKHFDRSRALGLLLDRTPLPTRRMPTDEELYAARELSRLRYCAARDIDPADAGYGTHNPLFQPDAALSSSHFLPYPRLAPPQLHFFNPSCAITPDRDVPRGHSRQLGLLMGRYLSGTLPRLSPSQFSDVLHKPRLVASERFLVYQILSLISFPNLLRLRYIESLSIPDVGRLALSAGVLRYDLSRHLECYCNIEYTHFPLHPLYPRALRNLNQLLPSMSELERSRLHNR